MADTAKPINNEQGRQRVKNMLEESKVQKPTFQKLEKMPKLEMPKPIRKQKPPMELIPPRLRPYQKDRKSDWNKV